MTSWMVSFGKGSIEKYIQVAAIGHPKDKISNIIPTQNRKSALGLALELVLSEFKDNYEEALAKMIARKSSGLPVKKNQLQSRLQ
jgi:hypothetical protein